MKTHKSLPTLLTLLIAVGCFQLSVFAQTSEDKGNFAAVTAGGVNVRWEMAIPTDGTLTISTPDGRIFRKEFSGGATPEFALTDQGERLPDGFYSYEIRLNPIVSALSKKAAMATRGRDDEPEALRAARKRAAPQSMVQSGHFAVMNGVVIVAGALEERGSQTEVQPRPTRRMVEPQKPGITAAAISKIRRHHLAFLAMPDSVIPDDLIVQGSACVGFDCVDGEVFDFDTVRLKENNTRLHFDDTSTTQGYPANNWQIRANSSSAGGGNFLGIVDQGASGSSETGTIVVEVDAGAPSNSIRVASNGRIGLRTGTPVLDLHIATSDTPAHRLEQTAGSFTAQTWDIAGNEANFFVRDVTGGSRLPFRIRPGAPTSSIDISASGKVGIGIASPAEVIHSKVTSGDSVWRMDTNTKAAGILKLFDATGDVAIQTNLTANAVYIKDNGDVGVGTTTPDQKFSVNGNASKSGGGSWQVFSDERLKSIKGNFNSGLKALMNLQPIRYEYRKDNALGLKSEGEHVGFGAQSLRKVIPEAVTETKSGYLMVNNDPIILTMLNAIKEQQKEIEQLKGEVRRLRNARRR